MLHRNRPCNLFGKIKTSNLVFCVNTPSHCMCFKNILKIVCENQAFEVNYYSRKLSYDLREMIQGTLSRLGQKRKIVLEGSCPEGGAF